MIMLEYGDSIAGISSSQLDGFFVGWSLRPTTDVFIRVLENSSQYVIAFDAQANKVVGFVTCISDGILSAYIPLLEVLPEYQHNGIGKELITRILEKTCDLYMVDLCCDRVLSSFYQSYG